MKTTKTLSLLLALMLVFSSMVLAQEKNDKEVYDTAKKSIYDKDWQAAIENLEYLIKTYQASKYLDDSLYWLGYSLHKMGDSLADMEKSLESKERSIAALNNLIAKYKDSAWVDDARILRVKIAEDLVDKGLSDYRAYISGSLLNTEDIQELSDLEHAELLVAGVSMEAMELENLGGALAYSTLDSLGGVLALEGLPKLTIMPSFEGIEGLYAGSLAYEAAAGQYDRALSAYEGMAVLGLTSGQDEEEKDPELELKLVALQALLNVDSEKAFPILVKILQDEGNPKLRRNAIFVLSRSNHPEVGPLMAKLATEDPDQEVQQQAIFWLGMRKDTESLDLLFKIFNDTDDPKIKQIALFSLSQNKSDAAKDKLISIARSEKDPKTWEQAIFILGQKRDEETVDLLISLYEQESDMDIKEKLIFGLIGIARKEKNPDLQKAIIFFLGRSKDDAALKYLQEIIEK
jgi:hypothetical protein